MSKRIKTAYPRERENPRQVNSKGRREGYQEQERDRE